MGRGRAKAKQTKVARELKYRQQGTDFSELQRELHGDDIPGGNAAAPDDEPEELDAYSRYVDNDDAESTRR